MSDRVALDRLQEVIVTQVNSWSKTVQEGIKEAAKVTVEEMVAETKQRPRGKFTTGAYARSIACKVGEDTLTRKSHVWYVKKPHYTLTHLINNGHSTYHGYYHGDRHVTIAAEKAVTKFEERVKEVVRNASN